MPGNGAADLRLQYSLLAAQSQVNVDGKVTIDKAAPGSDTHLLAKSLLLSENSISHVVPRNERLRPGLFGTDQQSGDPLQERQDAEYVRLG